MLKINIKCNFPEIMTCLLQIICTHKKGTVFESWQGSWIQPLWKVVFCWGLCMIGLVLHQPAVTLFMIIRLNWIYLNLPGFGLNCRWLSNLNNEHVEVTKASHMCSAWSNILDVSGFMSHRTRAARFGRNYCSYDWKLEMIYL